MNVSNNQKMRLHTQSVQVTRPCLLRRHNLHMHALRPRELVVPCAPSAPAHQIAHPPHAPNLLKLTPRPLSFAPVHASAGSSTSHRFRNTVPASTSPSSSRKRSGEAVKMDAVSAYALSFISASASPSDATRWMPTAGPNVSSRISAISAGVRQRVRGLQNRWGADRA
jgi:hypothetical protein